MNSYKKGMIYGNHDFAANFCYAVGYDDKFAQNHILIDEVGRLVTCNKKFVVDLLRKNGYNVTLNDSLVKIATVLSQQIEKENPAIIEPLIDIIYHTNDVHNFNAEGKIKEYIDKKGKSLHNLIQDGLISTFKKKDKYHSLDGQTLLNERIRLNEMYNAVGTTRMAKWVKICIWAGVAGLLIGGAIIAIKKFKPEIKPQLPLTQ